MTLPLLGWQGRHPLARILRQRFTLPPEAVAQLRGELRTQGSAYRGVAAADPTQSVYFPVVIRTSATGSRELFWPAVRTFVPASISVGLAVSIAIAAGTLGAAGLFGVALGTVVSGLIARTQYTLEREQHALEHLWVSAEGRWIALGAYPSLSSRMAGRLEWRLVPIEALAPPERLPRFPGWTELDGPVRVDAVLHAMGVLGLAGTLLDQFETERIYTLTRLARLRRRAQSRPALPAPSEEG